MPDAELSEDGLAQAANILRSAGYAIALVGAGISAESGVPTFRGEGGLWKKYGEPDHRGFQRFVEDPEEWWRNVIERRRSMPELTEALEKAEPNPAHLALAELERMGLMKHVITQNIDDLHQRAGSLSVTEIHGNRYKARCVSCNERWPASEIDMDDLPPPCPSCGSRLVKTDTVMFGEPIPEDALRECYRQTELCDAMFLVGTSAVVYPAADFPVQALRMGARLVEINPEVTPLSSLCAVVFRAPAGQVLPALVQRVKEPAE
ncbi:MAG: NAD-dependent deacylase [Dehalococcoidia bacterium]